MSSRSSSTKFPRTRYEGPMASARRAALRRAKRQLLLEALEPRALLASDWQNAFYSRDVNNDGIVTPQDVLSGINELNARTLIGPTEALPASG